MRLFVPARVKLPASHPRAMLSNSAKPLGNHSGFPVYEVSGVMAFTMTRYVGINQPIETMATSVPRMTLPGRRFFRRRVVVVMIRVQSDGEGRSRTPPAR